MHDVTAKVTLTPDGVILLDDVSARGLTGRVEAAASARFNGTTFLGARGRVQVAQKEALPLVADGVQVGLFDGRIDVTANPMAGGGLDVFLDVPTMRLQLPQDTTHDVQPLGDLGNVRYGVAREPGAFTPTAVEETDEPTTKSARRSPLRVAVHLKQAQIKRGSNLDVRLEGTPTVTVGDALHASGQLLLTHGTIDVEGKTFTIDNGTVTFVDDPTNPQIVLTASWVAPDTDRTRVYADFVGPLKTGAVNLRSEPAHTKSEIFSLILFGTIDTQGASGSTSTAGSTEVGAAGGVAGAAATAPVNRAIDSVLNGMGLGGSLGVAAKIDTSQVTPRPEVEVQIARDISVQVAEVIGLPPPGSNPDKTLLMLNWRFLAQWSLEATVGDAGTSILDLLWQHRY
jgi:translocation and assembly module TamB